VNPRAAQTLAAALAALLVILVGATIFIVLTGGRAGPTPRRAGASLPSFRHQSDSDQSRTRQPSRQPYAHPRPAQRTASDDGRRDSVPGRVDRRDGATADANAFAHPDPFTNAGAHAYTTTDTDSQPDPDANARSHRQSNLARPDHPARRRRLDQSAVTGSVPRIATFNVDGQSDVSARVSASTGPVRMCIWTEAVDDQRECHTVHNGASTSRDDDRRVGLARLDDRHAGQCDGLADRPLQCRRSERDPRQLPLIRRGDAR